MGEHDFPLGIPTTPSVGSIGEKNYKNPQHQKKKEKRKEEEKAPVLPKQDEVILSGNIELSEEKLQDPQKEEETDSDKENQKPSSHGDGIDIKI